MKLDLQLIPLGVCATAPIPSYNCYQTNPVLENNKFSFKYFLGPRQKASPKQQLKSYSFPSHFITVDYSGGSMTILLFPILYGKSS